MKIKSIYIDGLHNASAKTYEFNDIVYLFGHNGAGKSTVLQAIQFALLGYIPGTGKTKDAILRHSPANRIVVRLVLSGTPEVVVERKISSTGISLVVLPENYDIAGIIADIELPIFNFNEFVGQTANKLKEYFIKNILPTVDNVLDWEKILSDSISDCNFEDKNAIIKYGLSLIPVIDDTSKILEQVIQANAKFKEEQAFNKSELQRLQNTIDSLIYYDDYTGPTDMGKINSDLFALGALRDQLIKYNAATSATNAAKSELDELNANILTLGGKDVFDALEVELTNLNALHDEIAGKISAKNAELTALQTEDAASDAIISSKGVCPYTKETCKAIQNKIDDIRNQSAANKAKKIEIMAELSELDTERRNTEVHINQCESKIMNFHNTWNRIEVIQKTLTDLPAKPNTDKSIIDLNAEIEKLTESKSMLQANIQYNETIDNLTTEKFKAELRGEAIKHWVKVTDTNGLQTTLMEQPFEELADKMTEYICKMYGRNDIKAHFNLSNKANSFSFGLIRDGIYIPYDMLSSGEKCLYTLSLMICIIDNSNSPLKVMLCDDMFDHLDSSAIENTFASLKQVDSVQFIFAGVKDCENARDVMVEVS